MKKCNSEINKPKEIICLSCLVVQRYEEIVSRGNVCRLCGEPIDPDKLSGVEV